MEGNHHPSPPPSQTETTHHPELELSYDTIPLNTSATETRLLKLFPSADFSSPLHCRLYTAPISSPAPFKALSYAWGSDDKTHLIYVDTDDTSSHQDNDANTVKDVPSSNGDHQGNESDVHATPTPTKKKRRYIIRITSSLDSCLRHLRAIHHRDNPPTTEMTLWIDQLCIAQLNPHEKAVQVGLMTQIYSRAEQVLIWLGPEADGSDVVMDALAELEREYDGFGEDADEMLEGLMASLGIDGGMIAGKGTTGTTTICGGDNVLNTAGSNGPVADDGDGAGIGNNLGVDDTEVVEAPTPTLNPNKVSASTGRTMIEFVEYGAATVVRLWASGELQSFFRRSWFTRVWVVQEACLCEETAIVCGTRPPVDYDVLVLVCICMSYAIQDFERKGGYMPEWDSVSPIITDDEIAGVRMPRDTTRSLSRLMHQLAQSFSGRHSRFEQGGQEEEGDNLFTLLVDMYANVHSCREAKLHRDRIYALLGVAADVDELGIKPDYSSQTSTAHILTGVAKAIVSKTKEGFPVELLSYSQFPKTSLDDGSDEQLPSWVPDWRSGLQSPFYFDLDGDDEFRACGPHCSVDMVPTSTDPGTLGLRGYLVDAVEEVGCMSYAEDFPTTERWAESIAFFESLDRLWEQSKKKNKVIYATPERREEGLWRVPVGDMVHDLEHAGRHRARSEFGLEYRNWRCCLEQFRGLGFDIMVPGWRKSVDEDAQKRAMEWGTFGLGPDGGKAYDRAFVEMAKRRLYLTEKGYMGMGPTAMEPGDVVVVFPGARIPFVLRPTAEKDTFTYIGDAYCDGIMDGEITQREERQDFFLV